MNQQKLQENRSEKRASTRFRIQAPAIATFGGRELWAFTRDISLQAVHFRTAGDDEVPRIGETIEFLIKIPPSMSLSTPWFISGRGRTIRIDDQPGYDTGIIVEMLDYEMGTQPTHSDQKCS